MNKIQVFCDFDGTITMRDTIDVLLSELADPEWEAIEEEWVQGKIGSRECMERQVPLIRGGWNKVRELLDSLQITPGVADFVSWCRSKAIPFVVVSDGLDRIIEYLLQSNGIQADRIYANHLLESAAGEFSLVSSARPRLSGCGSGVCKCKIVGQPGYRLIRTVIGDGRSDFCWSKEADLLYAKGKLIEFCKIEGITCNPFDTFFDLKDSLSAVCSGSYEQVLFKKQIAELAPQTVPQNPVTFLS